MQAGNDQAGPTGGKSICIYHKTRLAYGVFCFRRPAVANVGNPLPFTGANGEISNICFLPGKGAVTIQDAGAYSIGYTLQAPAGKGKAAIAINGVPLLESETNVGLHTEWNGAMTLQHNDEISLINTGGDWSAKKGEIRLFQLYSAN